MRGLIAAVAFLGGVAVILTTVSLPWGFLMAMLWALPWLLLLRGGGL